MFQLQIAKFVVWCRSFRDACGSFVKLRASKDGKKLVVVSMNTSHNHPVKEVSN